MLSDNEVAMATAWNGRIAAIQEQGAPVAIGWRQGGLRTDAWAVPKGAPNRENAMKFTAFITLPVPQARLSMASLSFMLPGGRGKVQREDR